MIQGPQGSRVVGRAARVSVGMLTAGVVAAVGALGPASAQASSTILARYSDSTDAMKYLPAGHTCPTGSTQIS